MPLQIGGLPASDCYMNGEKQTCTMTVLLEMLILPSANLGMPARIKGTVSRASESITLAVRPLIAMDVRAMLGAVSNIRTGTLGHAGDELRNVSARRLDMADARSQAMLIYVKCATTLDH